MELRCLSFLGAQTILIIPTKTYILIVSTTLQGWPENWKDIVHCVNCDQEINDFVPTSSDI